MLRLDYMGLLCCVEWTLLGVWKYYVIETALREILKSSQLILNRKNSLTN